MAVFRATGGLPFFFEQAMRGKRKDWTGARQGRLTVVGYAGGGRWTCKCDCGTVFETSAQSLRQEIQSCGCMHKEEMSARLTKDETGKRYGRLVVEGRVSPVGKAGGVLWQCRCDCGNARVVRGSLLRSGFARDCGKGCPLKKKKEEKHGNE